MPKKTLGTLVPIAAAIRPTDDHAPIHAALQHFDKLPDSATARAPVVAALFSISVPTVWRWTRDKRLPAPTRRGGVTTWSVGALRRILAGSDDAGVVPRTATATAAATARRSATAPAG